MKVEKIIELSNGHKIEFGKASWDEQAVSLRNRYPTKNGGFSPRSSSEIPIEDLKIILTESVKNGYIPKSALIEIAETCISALKFDGQNQHVLNRSDKLSLMKQASSDLLYLSDVEAVSGDFKSVDHEF